MTHLLNGEIIEPDQEFLDGFAASQAEFAAQEPERLAAAIRRERDIKLREEVDPIVTNPLRWADLTTEQQDAWKAYRQALLDVTEQAGFPEEVTWPTKP
jgi:hypothetical protein